MKRLWQRRRVCVTENGEFCLYHADETKAPVRLSLLTCQLKIPLDTSTTAADASSTTPDGSVDSNTKRSFFLVSSEFPDD